MIILDCQFTLIAKIPIAECPIAKVPIAKCPIAVIPIAACPIAKCPIAERPIAKCLIAQVQGSRFAVCQSPLKKDNILHKMGFVKTGVLCNTVQSLSKLCSVSYRVNPRVSSFKSFSLSSISLTLKRVEGTK